MRKVDMLRESTGKWRTRQSA